MNASDVFCLVLWSLTCVVFGILCAVRWLDRRGAQPPVPAALVEEPPHSERDIERDYCSLLRWRHHQQDRQRFAAERRAKEPKP